MEWNLLVVPTCRANRKGFLSDDLELNENAQHREYICKVDPCFGMVITRWKDSRMLQTITTMMEKGTPTVQRWTGREVQSVDVHDYQDGMCAVDKVDQQRALGNAAPFKKWYKKEYFGVADCSMLQSFYGWNLSADELAACLINHK
eukprot:2650454-Ditylum_brightwellii.AAC.1